MSAALITPDSNAKDCPGISAKGSVSEALAYPDRYELMVDIEAVGRIKIRPFRPNDVTLFEALFKSLTPRSIYLRFFCFLKQLPPTLRDQLAYIDHNRDIALVGMLQQEDKEIMVAEARVTPTGQNHNAEFSVLVADPWQGRGIGACLLQHCLDIARQRRYKRIFGVVLADNIHMLALGKKLGFSAAYCPSTREYELSKTYEENE